MNFYFGKGDFAPVTPLKKKPVQCLNHYTVIDQTLDRDLDTSF
jgi:hypothetical protein